ncbi:hypothetical protein K431DRAFT_85995 [Polychaeton citri CBS 116435]|uniref:Uncharacterized protein n=1 Tax=Polychaeton citri CBS 116435 TaxID=1314669 RepID=A0A9P4Q710_9PEZI|nr:hypothetical protein K431DRAFT_85995 [Polychaeton citri CBS 116435]
MLAAPATAVVTGISLADIIWPSVGWGVRRGSLGARAAGTKVVLKYRATAGLSEWVLESVLQEAKGGINGRASGRRVEADEGCGERGRERVEERGTEGTEGDTYVGDEESENERVEERARAESEDY